jgi:hypothetical protein
MAVGRYEGEDSVPALAEQWNESKWATETAVSPTGAEETIFEDVSCTTSSACTATGYYQTATGEHFTLAERWNGSSWAIETTPSPSETDATLSGVSCSSKTDCIAVGFALAKGGKLEPLAELWNGTTWETLTVAIPAGGEEEWLSGVSCPTKKSCTVVGSVEFEHVAHGLAETWNGSSWTVNATPWPLNAQDLALNGVSCTTAKACTAIGSNTRDIGGAKEAVVLRWNGTEWQLEEAPDPTEELEAGEGDEWELDGVSCLSSTYCVAVGAYNNPGEDPVALAEVWNGVGWALEPPVSRPGTEGNVLLGVSCAAEACTATGYSKKSSTETETLGERQEAP